MEGDAPTVPKRKKKQKTSGCLIKGFRHDERSVTPE